MRKNLLKLQLDRNGVLSRDCVSYVVANTERLILRLPTQIDKQRIRIAIDDTGAPFLIRFYQFDCLKYPT
jgi:hypothetical protein